MSPRELELALKKQRLQIQSAMLRARLSRQAQAFEPAFEVLDTVRSAYAWLRARPYIWVGAAVVVGVVKPRRIWRWLKRGVVWWQAAQRLRGLTERLAPLYAAWRLARKDG